MKGSSPSMRNQSQEMRDSEIFLQLEMFKFLPRPLVSTFFSFLVEFNFNSFSFEKRDKKHPAELLIREFSSGSKQRLELYLTRILKRFFDKSNNIQFRFCCRKTRQNCCVIFPCCCFFSVLVSQKPKLKQLKS